MELIDRIISETILFYKKCYNYNFVKNSFNDINSILKKISNLTKSSEDNGVDETIFFYQIKIEKTEEIFNNINNLYNNLNTINKNQRNVYCININNEIAIILNYHSFNAIVITAFANVLHPLFCYGIFYLISFIIPEITLYITDQNLNTNVLKIEQMLIANNYNITFYYLSEKKFEDNFLKKIIKFITFEPLISKIDKIFDISSYNFYSIITKFSISFNKNDFNFIKQSGQLKNFDIELLHNEKANTYLLKFDKNKISINFKHIENINIPQIILKKLTILIVKYLEYVKKIEIVSENNSEENIEIFKSFLNTILNKSLTIYIKNEVNKNILLCRKSNNNYILISKIKNFYDNEENNIIFYSSIFSILLTKKETSIKFIVKENKKYIIKYDKTTKNHILYSLSERKTYNKIFLNLIKSLENTLKKNILFIYNM